MQPKLKEKRWNKRLEQELLKKWARKKLYSFDIKRSRIFTIDTPPPYPSGRPWHIGAAAHYAQIDMIARTARAQGFNVYFPIGIDRNGLPVELYTERKHNIHMQDVSREKFIKLCRTALDDLEAEMLDIMRGIGLSCDFQNYYRTDSSAYRAMTQATFIQLWEQGLIYEDTRPNNYCLSCGTTIADAEIAYQELKTELMYIKFKLKETGKDIIIATTRPELLCSCQVVLVNPADSRYKKIIGKHAIVPLYKREVEIVTHPYAKPEFGTGIVMMCSYGDYSDVRVFRELGLPEIIAIGTKGKMTKAAGKYTGLSIKEARLQTIKDLEHAGLVVKKEHIAHRTPICERCKTPIQIIPMQEFYLKQLGNRAEIKKIAKKMTFFPPRHRQILLDWVDSITLDWPISRRRCYGTEIPIWYCKCCGKPNLPKPGPYYQPWLKTPPFKKCAFCKESRGWNGEIRTFDTWMDSSVSPLFTSKWQNNQKFFSKTFPNSIRPQGKEIIRTWLYYTLLRCWQLTGKPAFKNTWIMGWGVDEKGEKMSKSKGNVIDPIPILEKHGADAFRFWAAAEASLGSDFRCSEERILTAAKFLTKLWNVARFISGFPVQKSKPKLQALDKWILAELAKLVKKCINGYKRFNFFIPVNAIRDFIWIVFAPHYIELVKARAYGNEFKPEESKSALFTLHKCLETILLLLAPITPFITDHVFRQLYSPAGIYRKTFPKPGKLAKAPFKTPELIELNSQIWKAKKDRGLSLKTEIKALKLPSRFKAIEHDLIQTHKIKSLRYGKMRISIK